MKREIGDYVQDIVEAMNNAMEFTNDMAYGEFVQNTKTIYAVVRAIEIVGETVKNIPEEIRKKYPEIPWRQMAGMRDKLIHEYFGVQLERVWETAKRDIPNLKPLFEKMLSDLEKSNRKPLKNL